MLLCCVVCIFFSFGVSPSPPPPPAVWQWVHMIYVVCLFKTAEATAADRKPFMSRLVGLLVQCAGGGICVAMLLGQPAPWLLSPVYVPSLLAVYIIVFYIPFALYFSLMFLKLVVNRPASCAVEEGRDRNKCNNTTKNNCFIMISFEIICIHSPPHVVLCTLQVCASTVDVAGGMATRVGV